MNVLDFPKELQCFILAKLDGRALGRAKFVCRAWCDIVGHLESQFNIWLRCCMKEINSSILVELSGMSRFIEQGQITADVCSHVGWKFWRNLYREFRRSELVTRWDHTTIELTIPFVYGKATTIDIGAGFLVTGHATGNVLLWENLRQGEDPTVGLVHKHHQHVSCVKVVQPVLEMSLQDNCRTKTSSPCVVSASRDSIINVSAIRGTDTRRIAHFSQQVNDISVCGEYFVAAARSAVLNGQPVWRVQSSQPLTLQQTNQLRGHWASNVTAVAMTFEMVVSGDVCGNLLMWDTSVQDPREPEVIYKFTSSVKHVCLQGQRLACLLDDGSLCIKRGTHFQEWTADSLFPTLEGTPKCLALRGTMMAVATTFGGLFLYNVPDVKSWENVDFQHPDCTIRIGKNSITALSLGDDGRSPVVAIAADDETVSVIRWQPS